MTKVKTVCDSVRCRITYTWYLNANGTLQYVQIHTRPVVPADPAETHSISLPGESGDGWSVVQAKKDKKAACHSQQVTTHHNVNIHNAGESQRAITVSGYSTRGGTSSSLSHLPWQRGCRLHSRIHCRLEHQQERRCAVLLRVRFTLLWDSFRPCCGQGFRPRGCAL